MKSFLKKANRGILLFSVIVLGVVVYLFALAAVQNREKPAIEALCLEYAATEVKYSMLPEAYRGQDTEMPEAKQQEYLAEMRQAIGPFYVDNERVFQLAQERMSAVLQNQIEGWDRVQSYEKVISSFESFAFDGDQVTVTFKTQSIIERLEGGSVKMSGGRVAAETKDTMILQKTDGQWFVVYASLSQPFQDFRY